MFKKIVSWLTGVKPNPKYEHPLDAVTAPKQPPVQMETVITAQPPQPEKKTRKPRTSTTPIKSPAIAAWPSPLHKPEKDKPTSTVTLAELEALQVAPVKKERKPRKPKA